MKLYAKQLHSLEELRREKQVMKYAVKHTDDWLSLKEMSKEARPKDAATLGMIAPVLSAFGSKSLLQTAISLVPMLLNLMPKRRAEKKKSFLDSVAKEVIFGYLKWKAIQITYRSLMRLVNAKKHKEEAA